MRHRTPASPTHAEVGSPARCPMIRHCCGNQCAAGRCVVSPSAAGSCGRCRQPIANRRSCQNRSGIASRARLHGEVPSEPHVYCFADLGQPCDAIHFCHYDLSAAGMRAGMRACVRPPAGRMRSPGTSDFRPVRSCLSCGVVTRRRRPAFRPGCRPGQRCGWLGRLPLLFCDRTAHARSARGVADAGTGEAGAADGGADPNLAVYICEPLMRTARVHAGRPPRRCACANPLATCSTTWSG